MDLLPAHHSQWCDYYMFAHYKRADDEASSFLYCLYRVCFKISCLCIYRCVVFPKKGRSLNPHSSTMTERSRSLHYEINVTEIITSLKIIQTVLIKFANKLLNMSSCYSQCTAVKSHRKQRDTNVTPLCDNFIVNI